MIRGAIVPVFTPLVDNAMPKWLPLVVNPKGRKKSKKIIAKYRSIPTVLIEVRICGSIAKNGFCGISCPRSMFIFLGSGPGGNGRSCGNRQGSTLLLHRIAISPSP